MRSAKNPKYLEFSKTELVVEFASDRGELRTNDFGEYFFRSTMDGRFTCASPDLERCLVNAGYTANQRVGITKKTLNRSVYWTVRMIDAPAADGHEPSKNAPSAARNHTPSENGAQRQEPNTRATPAPPIPASKYATPPAAEGPALESLLNASVVAVKAAKEPPALMTRTAALSSGIDQVCDSMQQCLTRALDMICAAQKSAVEQGCAINFLGADVQDLASTIYIQLGKQANIASMNRNDDARRAGGGDAWRH